MYHDYKENMNRLTYDAHRIGNQRNAKISKCKIQQKLVSRRSYALTHGKSCDNQAIPDRSNTTRQRDNEKIDVRHAGVGLKEGWQGYHDCDVTIKGGTGVPVHSTNAVHIQVH